MARISQITLTFFGMSLFCLVVATPRFVPTDEWASYKATFNKTYTSAYSEERARTNYAANTEAINKHNMWYNVGSISYSLKVNQFTDMHFEVYKSPFPIAISSVISYEKPAPIVQPAAVSYDPRNMGIELNIENQGTKCYSGWAYAAAKSVELFKALRTGNKNPLSLSAQNLIDCAGQWKACFNQIPQAAFDYLTQHKMHLHFEKDYRNQNNSKQAGMCTPPACSQQSPTVSLTAYSKIKDGDDESLKAYVSAGMPVVVEFNHASFYFLHYSDGIFQKPLTADGSHFMVVIGYGTDNSTKMDYWLLQNSFGTSWGRGGLLKLRRSPGDKIAKNAIFPSE